VKRSDAGRDEVIGTSYLNGEVTTGATVTSGGGDGPLLLEGTQVGTLIYRVDGGDWQAITTPATITEDGGTNHVQVAYIDRPGS
jgi:hypothetical protein